MYLRCFGWNAKRLYAKRNSSITNYLAWSTTLFCTLLCPMHKHTHLQLSAQSQCIALWCMHACLLLHPTPAEYVRTTPHPHPAPLHRFPFTGTAITPQEHQMRTTRSASTPHASANNNMITRTHAHMSRTYYVSCRTSNTTPHAMPNETHAFMEYLSWSPKCDGIGIVSVPPPTTETIPLPAQPGQTKHERWA